MANLEKIEKIKKVSKSSKTIQQLQQPEELQRLAPNKQRFDNLMQVEKPQEQLTQNKLDPSTKRNSLFDEARVMSSQSQPRVTPTELIAQTEQAINRMEDIKSKLQTPGLEIKDSVNNLLQNKLTHIDDNIRIALNKTGLEGTSGVPTTLTLTPPPSQNPIMRFLGFMTDGQYQMKRLALQVENWHLNGVDINPAAMLSVQIKVNYITQELEFFSSLLNKALESTKTIMNVQI